MRVAPTGTRRGKPVVAFHGPIEDEEDVRRFYEAIDDAGVSGHPDTPFDDVVDRTGRRYFTRVEARRLDALQTRCFEVSPDPYRISLAVWNERHREVG